MLIPTRQIKFILHDCVLFHQPDILEAVSTAVRILDSGMTFDDDLHQRWDRILSLNFKKNSDIYRIPKNSFQYQRNKELQRMLSEVYFEPFESKKRLYEFNRIFKNPDFHLWNFLKRVYYNQSSTEAEVQELMKGSSVDFTLLRDQNWMLLGNFDYQRLLNGLQTPVIDLNYHEMMGDTRLWQESIDSFLLSAIEGKSYLVTNNEDALQRMFRIARYVESSHNVDLGVIFIRDSGVVQEKGFLTAHSLREAVQMVQG